MVVIGKVTPTKVLAQRWDEAGECYEIARRKNGGWRSQGPTRAVVRVGDLCLPEESREAQIARLEAKAQALREKADAQDGGE